MIFVIMNSVNSCFQETIELSIINHFLACSNGWDFEKYVKKNRSSDTLGLLNLIYYLF